MYTKIHKLIRLLVLVAMCDMADVSCSLTYGAESKIPHSRVMAFTATWCPTCQRDKPALEKLKQAGVDVLPVDVDRFPGLVKDYDVPRIPTYIVMDTTNLGDPKEITRTRELSDLLKPKVVSLLKK